MTKLRETWALERCGGTPWRGTGQTGTELKCQCSSGYHQRSLSWRGGDETLYKNASCSECLCGSNSNLWHLWLTNVFNASFSVEVSPIVIIWFLVEYPVYTLDKISRWPCVFVDIGLGSALVLTKVFNLCQTEFFGTSVEHHSIIFSQVTRLT